MKDLNGFSTRLAFIDRRLERHMASDQRGDWNDYEMPMAGQL